MANLISTGFTCARCGKEIFREEKSFTTGYGTNDRGEKHCFACCGEEDKQWMRDHGKITLYLTIEQPKDLPKGYWRSSRVGKVSNWPGSLKFENLPVHRGKHNIARYRYDTWFNFEGYVWHGVTYGDNTEICHCHRTKERTENSVWRRVGE